MTRFSARFWKYFASLNITIAALTAFFVLVFVGTLDQVNLGIFYAQKKYFQSFFVYWQVTPSMRVPVFPGGFLIGIVLLLNLMAVIMSKRLFQWKKIGLCLVHVGIVFLILGFGLTSFLAVESQLALSEGETKSYSKDSRFVELALVDRSHSEYDEVISIPESVLKRGGKITVPGHPFSMEVLSFYENVQLLPKINHSESQKETVGNPIIEGIGANLHVRPMPVLVRDDQLNFVTVLLRFFDQNNRAVGTWLFSRGLSQPQVVTVGGKPYDAMIRPIRYYENYSLTLKKFSHDVYPGTSIPKNFSSLVHLSDPEKKESRDTLIYMNHPLRYQNKTYYQASYGENNTLSVLQVVANPGWLLPYFSSILIALGLCIHFFMVLFQRRRRSV